MRPLLFLILVAASIPTAFAENPAKTTAAEARTILAFNTALKDGPLSLRAFLKGMPKGADLHNHLAGAVYAEDWIRAAGQDGLCVDPTKLSFATPPCNAPLVPAANVPATDQPLYDKLLNAFSMRSYVPTSGWSGHDQFFSTFAHFQGTNPSHNGEWVDEVATRAAAQNEQYVELMDTPSFAHAATLAHQLGWNDNLATMRQKLLDNGLRDEIPSGREQANNALTERDRIEHCNTPEATAACGVKVQFIYQILRAFPKEQVFAQTLLGFETIAAGNEYVGINFVQPEDAYTAMADYTLQMKMLDYLHTVYPQVRITLHAGELAPGIVTPDGLRFHIRQAIELGHAQRIGHGVDALYEDHPQELLKEMAQKHIMVEINLTSNEGILGVSGKHHPLPLYRAAHVPVALSTDDEGVNRSTITQEYTKAALDFHLSYLDLKQMARTSIEHAFLDGASLWAAPDNFTRATSTCAAQILGNEHPSASCKAFLDKSQRAQQQWELEHRFRVFELQF